MGEYAVEATRSGDYERVSSKSYSISAPTDYNVVDKHSRSAAHWAARLGHLKILQLLRDRGAALDQRLVVPVRHRYYESYMDLEDGATPFLGKSVARSGGRGTRHSTIVTYARGGG